LALGLLMAVSAAWAQTNLPARRPENRCLLVVETSRSMQRRLDGVLRSVKELLDAGMGGELQRGDTLGLWTFNEEVSAGRFPLQPWSAEDQIDVTSRVLSFLKEQKYEKQSRLGQVLPALDLVLKNSEFLTVVVVSGGESTLQGSPFDKQVNEVFAEWRERLQQSRMPFVTVLRAAHGKFTTFAVTPAPSRVEWPPLAPEFLAKRAAPKALPIASPVPKPATSAPVVLPPLILSGKKSESKPVVQEPVPTTVPVSSNMMPAPGEDSATGRAETPQTPAPAHGVAAASEPVATTTERMPLPLSPATLAALDPPRAVPVEIQPQSASAQAASVSPSPIAGTREVQPAADQLLGPELTRPETKPRPKQTTAGIAREAAASTVDDSRPTQRLVPPDADSEKDPASSPFGGTILFLIILGAAAVVIALAWVYGARSQVPPLGSLITESLDKNKG